MGNGRLARAARSRRLFGEPLECRRLLTLALAGFEDQVNLSVALEQQHFRESPQALAIGVNGFGVSTWAGVNQDGDGWGVTARRIAPGGIPFGRELAVNTTTAGDQMFSSVAMDGAGNFVIVWRSIGAAGALARRYNAFGVPQGREFQVNTYDSVPAIALDDAGNFVIVAAGSDEQGNGVFGQRFDPIGTAVGLPFKVSISPSDRDAYPQIAMDPAGDFVVTWTAPDSIGSGIYGRVYNAAAEPQSDSFQVNQTEEGTQWFSTIDTDVDGDFVITWTGQAQVGGRFLIFARRYAAGGLARGDEFTVAPPSSDDAQYSRVAMQDSGDFVITWTAKDIFGDGVFARRFDAAGAPLELFQVNNLYIEGNERISAIATDPDGDFTVTWTAIEPYNTSADIHIQAYESNNPPLAVDDVAATDELTPIFIDILVNDSDADGLIIPSSVTIVLQPEHGFVVVDPATGGLFYTPEVGYVGPVTIGYTVADEQLAVSNVGFVSITIVSLPSRPWQNPINRYDVDNDGVVAPLDALVIINDLNAFGGGRPLQIPPAGAQIPPPFFDVSGDDFVSALDALQVINQLSAAPSPAPLADPSPALADAALADFGLLDAAFVNVQQRAAVDPLLRRRARAGRGA